jgi:hypothetical protein
MKSRLKPCHFPPGGTARDERAGVDHSSLASFWSPPKPRRFLPRLLALASFSLLPAPAATTPILTESSAPAVNWVLPIFTDKEGFRSMTLRGSEVRPVGRSIAVTDLSITIFSGDATSSIDSMLLSPSAVFVPKEHSARGDKSVRFIRDDIEVTGVGWTYDHTAKKVSLQQNVRVTFRAQLNDILK